MCANLSTHCQTSGRLLPIYKYCVWHMWLTAVLPVSTFLPGLLVAIPVLCSSIEIPLIWRSSLWLEHNSYIWSGLALSALTDSRCYETTVERSLMVRVLAGKWASLHNGLWIMLTVLTRWWVVPNFCGMIHRNLLRIQFPLGKWLF